MSNPYFYARPGEPTPPLEVRFLTDGGQPLAVTSASFTLYLLAPAPTPLFTRSAEVVDGPGGLVRYVWQFGDFPTLGDRLGKFTVNGETFPEDRYVEIIAD